MSSDAKMPGQWQSVQLGDLVDSGVLLTQNGFAQGGFNEDGFGVPHMRPFNISEAGEVTLSQIKSVEPPPSTSQCWLRAGDVLFNNSNSEDLVGKTAYWSLDGRYTLSNHMTLIRSLAPETVDTYWLARLLHYLWQTKVFKSLCRRYVGQASISLEKLRSVRLSLPPIDEQRAIARVLRAVQVAREARQREVTLERERKAALMAHLFTHGTRGEPTKQTPIGEMPVRWEVSTIGEWAILVNSGSTPRGGHKSYLETGIPLIRSQNVLMSRLDMSDVAYISQRTHKDMDRSEICFGDILLNITGASIGRVAHVPDSVPVANVNQHVCRIRLQVGEVGPAYLAGYLTTPEAQSRIMGAQSGTTRQGLTFGQIRRLQFPLPSLDEQQLIAEALTACDAKIAALEREGALLDELFRALLEELMTGRVAVAGVEEGDG